MEVWCCFTWHAMQCWHSGLFCDTFGQIAMHGRHHMLMDISQLSRVAAQVYPWHCCDSSSVFRGQRGRDVCDKATAPRASTASVCLAIPASVTHVLAHHATILGISDSHGDGLLCQVVDWRPAENYHSVHYVPDKKVMPLTIPEKMTFTDGY